VNKNSLNPYAEINVSRGKYQIGSLDVASSLVRDYRAYSSLVVLFRFLEFLTSPPLKSISLATLRSSHFESLV
jgi:hypothetical protein